MSEEDSHDWITNGLEQKIPYQGTEPQDRSDRVDYVEEDLAAISRDEGILINPAITGGKLL